MLMINNSGSYASFTNRLCARRILSFLRRHYLEGSAHQLERETKVFFDLHHLRFLATTARWDELISYVALFFPYGYPDPTLSIQADNFLYWIRFYRVLAVMIAAGGKQVERVENLWPILDAKADPQIAALRAFFDDVRRRPPRSYANLLRIWEAAAKRLEDLALQCPELKGKLCLPRYAPKPYTPKRWQINLSGVRPILRPYKKEVQKKACDVASFFDEKREEINKSLPGLSSDSMRFKVQTEATVHEASGVNTSAAAGALGGDGGQIGSKETDNTSTSMKKRKESKTLDIADAGDAATRAVKSRKYDSSPL